VILDTASTTPFLSERVLAPNDMKILVTRRGGHVGSRPGASDGPFECLVIFSILQRTATSPCRTALQPERCLPSSVIVPVLLRALGGWPRFVGTKSLVTRNNWLRFAIRAGFL
jgi:hypothetical protein